MSGLLTGLLFMLILVLAAAAWAIWTINGFTAKEMKVSEARSGVEVALTKRYDVLRKLLEVTRGYLAYEYAVLLQMVQLRRGMSMGEIYDAENRMDALTEQIRAVGERFPPLKSSRVFRELQIGMTDTESQLEAARRIYNSNVQMYNTALSQFPASLLAGRRRPAPFFYAKQGVHKDMTMTF